MTILSGPTRRLLALVAFALACFVVVVYILTGTEYRVPIIQPEGYTAVVTMRDVDNLVPASKVRMVGVEVGTVHSMQRVDDGIKVTFGVNEEVAPLHRGVNVRLGERSLIGEGYLDVTDGSGEALPKRTHLPDSAVQPSVQLHDVLRSLDPQARKDLGGLIRGVAKATGGTQQDLSATMEGLGHLGREGNTALDAIAAQSSDLRKLARDTTTLLRALDTGEGQIATMVENAETLTAATSGQRASIAETMRLLPGVLDSARTASGSINEVSGALGPVAANLRSASPFLNDSLRQLPSTTRDLRAMLPSLSSTLDRAPATLRRVPAFAADVRAAVPPAEAMLRDVNPMLAYIEPYGPELASYFANFNAALQYTDEDGVHYIRLTPVINEKSPQAPIQSDALGTYNNPIPDPGTGATPGPYQGKYPHVERAPK